GSTPPLSVPTAVTTPVRQSVSIDAGMISPRFVSDSSSDGWTTTKSSSGSSERSMLRASRSCTSGTLTAEPPATDAAPHDLRLPLRHRGRRRDDHPGDPAAAAQLEQSEDGDRQPADHDRRGPELPRRRARPTFPFAAQV